MKILFIENRYATLIWAKVAEALEAAGHTVHWIVQNKMFTPASPRVFQLGYPSPAQLSDAPLPPELQAIAATDRSFNHFGLRPAHYAYYHERIGAAIDSIAPDVVFGESTQFHELMAIARCKAKGIPFLAPNATRYPVGRLVFFRYDTFEPVGGCGQRLDGAAAAQLLDDVRHRRVVPSYMEAPKADTAAKLKRAWEKARITAAWAAGERFITPAPWVKYRLDRGLSQARAAWDALAAQRQLQAGDARWVLYPLQLQPESNLDVFGLPWRDQTATMVRAARALAPLGASLVVKPNPKSKYEMCEALVEAARAHPNVIPLDHRATMGPVFNAAPVVLSVTGTVILESIFAGKPVGVLGTHGMADLAGVSRLRAPEDVAGLLAATLEGSAIRATREQAIDALNNNYAISYDALLWDPITRPDLLATECVARLQRAFADVLRHLPAHQARAETPCASY